MTRLVAVATAVLAAVAAAQDKVELNTITKVQVSGGAITITGTKKPSFTTFTMTDPARLVIDISEAVFSGVADEQQVGNGVVTAIKTASYGSDASAIARVLIGFEKEYETDIQTSDTKLVVKVLGAGGGGGTEVAQADKQPAGGQATADKAAADKAAADKAAADKAAAQQATADKAAADKAAKEQAAADKASAAQKAKDDALAKKEAERQAKEQAEAEKKATAEQKKQEAEAAKQAAAEEKKKKAEEAAAAAEQKKQEAEAAKHATAEEKKTKAEAAAAEREQKKQEAEAAKQAAAEEKKKQAEEAAAEREQKKQEALTAKQSAAEEKKKLAEEAAAEREQKKQEALAAKQSAAEEKKKLAEEAAAEREAKRQEALAAKQQKKVAMAETSAPQDQFESSSSLSVSGRRKNLTFVGFKQEPGTQRVYVRTSEPVRYSLSKGGDKEVVLELENTSISLHNNTRFMDTSYFNGAVALVHPRTGPTRTVRVEIKLKENVPYEAKQEGNEVYVDFQSGGRK
ncbi:MAG TPA: AMIN domain-containing protein [Myxococcaceae bacterium]|nr:AMIN domain-containing protein [Myxococcaceae bacterium]